MIKLEVTTIKNSHFCGHLPASMLTDKQRLQLNVSEKDKVEFVGDYIVAWDDDIPMVEIDGGVVAYKDMAVVDLEVDEDALADLIQEYGPVEAWAEDRISAAMDHDWNMDR